jgi:hypothetical protein
VLPRVGHPVDAETMTSTTSGVEQVKIGVTPRRDVNIPAQTEGEYHEAPTTACGKSSLDSKVYVILGNFYADRLGATRQS